MNSTGGKLYNRMIFLCFLFVFVITNSLSLFAGPSFTTYQAKIIKPDGNPLEASNVNFKFSILNPAASCIVYSELYSSVNMTGSQGLISFSLGSGVRTYPASGTVTFEKVFANSTPSLACDTGGPPSYSPGANDVRKIVMQFFDGTAWQTLPAMSINAVPYAMYANDSQKLNGKADTDFVEVANIPTCLTNQALFFNGMTFSCVTTQSVSATAVISALGYTPANAASLTTVTSTVGLVSSTLTSLQNTVAASFAAISASSGLTSLNGSTSSTQTFANGVAGTAPAFLTANGVHTLNIPLASAGAVTAGLISNFDYLNFAGKITSSAASIAQVLGYTPLSAASATQWTTSGTTINYMTGNVGIGTTEPGTTLDILSKQPGATAAPYNVGMMLSAEGSDVGSRMGLMAASTLATNYPIFLGQRSRGTLASPTAVQNWDALFSILGKGYDGTSWGSATGGITLYASENWSPSARGSFMNFTITPNSTTTAVEAMRITNAGNVGIGTAAPSAKLHLSSGTSTVASFKLTSGTLLMSPASGSIEYDGFDFYFTDGTNTRRSLASYAGSGAGSSYTSLISNASGSITLSPLNSVIVSSTTASTSFNTGALIVAGGVGVAGNIFSSGAISTSSNIQGSSITALSGVSTTVITGAPSLALNPYGGNVGIGTTTPNSALHVVGLVQSTNVRAASQSAAFPAFSFSSNTNTGIFNPTANAVGISTNGNEAVRIDGSGNVSIGTTGAANYRLSSSDSPADPSTGFTAGRFSQNPTFSANNAQFGYGILASISPVLATGVSTTGGLAGLQANALISSGTGTVNNLYGLVSSYGNQTGTTGTIAAAYGLFVHPIYQAGTVHSGYGIYIRAPSSGGTIFNDYGLYQASTSSMNYFGGNVGLGIISPTAKLHLSQGTSTVAPIRLTSGTLLASPVSGSIEYDGFDFYFTDGTNTRRSLASFSGGGSSNTSLVSNASGDIALAPLNSVIVSSTTASTNSQTGALIVSGGVGVAGNIFASGTIITSSNIQGASITATNGVSTTVITGVPFLALNPSGGNVGIGTTNTNGFKLYVNGNTYIGGSVMADWGNAAAPSFATSGGSGFYQPTTNSMSLVTSNTDRVRIDGSGNVAIGTTTPSARLTVSGTGATSATASLHILNGVSSSLMYVRDDGNVGIGTTNPNSTFDVNGTMRATNIINPTSGAGLELNYWGSGGSYVASVDRGAGTNKVLNLYGSSIKIGVGAAAGSYNTYFEMSPSGTVMFGGQGQGTSTISLAGDASRTIGIERDQSGTGGRPLTIRSGGGTATYTNQLGGDLTLAAGTATGNGSSNIYLQTATAGGSGSADRVATTKMTVLGSGNVGIGTTNPTATLTVSGTGTTSATASLHILNGASSSLMFVRNDGNIGIGTTTPAGLLDVQGGTAPTGVAGKSLFLIAQNGGMTGGAAGNVSITAGWGGSMLVPGGNVTLTGGQGSTGGHIFLMPGTGTPQGNVGIGTSFTSARLTVSGTGATSATASMHVINGASSSLMYVRNDGNVGISTMTPREVLEVGYAHFFHVGGVIAQGFNSYWSSANSRNEFGGYGSNKYAATTNFDHSTGLLIFRNSSNSGNAGSAIAWNTGLAMDSSGNVGINTTTPGYKLDVSGTINIASGSALAFGGTSVCTAAGCTSSSDERLKENIKPLDFDLNTLLSLNAVEYDWKNKAKYGEKHQIGFIAQDLEKAYPEVVYTDKNTGLKSVTYGHLVAPIIEALKSLYKRIVGVEDQNLNQDRQIASIAESKADKEQTDDKIKQLEAENAAKSKQIEALKAYLCSKDPSAPICQ